MSKLNQNLIQISLKGSVQLKALLEEEDTALPLQPEEKEGRKISSRIEAATNSEEEDRSVGFTVETIWMEYNN